MIFMVVGIGISVVLLGVSYMLGEKKGDSEKLTAYECGFDPFSDARNKFDVGFYVVAILFIIFDLEASYLFPWAMVIERIGGVGYWVMMDFLFELCVGYIYAWKVGALEF